MHAKESESIRAKGAAWTRCMGLLLAGLAVLSGAWALPARAGPFSAMKDWEIASARSKIELELDEHHAPTRFASRFVVVAPERDRGCPVSLKVSNPWDGDMWNVAAVFHSGRTGSDTVLTAHVPLLPAKSSTMVEFNCDRARAGSYEGFAKGPSLDDDTVAAMLKERADTNQTRDQFFAVTSGSGNVAQLALPLLTSSREGGSFIKLLLRTLKGQEALSESLAGTPDAAVVQQVQLALRKAPAREAGAVVERLAVKTSALAPEVVALVDELLPSLCGTAKRPGPQRKALGMRAPSPGPLRSILVARCGFGSGALDEKMVAMLADSPEDAASVLQLVDEEQFQALVQALGEGKAGAGLQRFLRDVRDEGRFDAVASRLSAEDAPAAVREVAQLSSDALAARKARFVGEQLDQLHAASAPAAGAQVLALVKLQAEGKVTQPLIVKELTRRRSWAEPGFSDWVKEQLRSRPSVVLPESVLGQETLDPMEYLARLQPRLASCEATMLEIEACAAVLDAEPSLSGVKLQPGLLARLSAKLASATPVSTDVPRLAQIYGRFGLDKGPIAEAACDAAAAARSDPEAEALLAFTRQVDPAAACIGGVESRRRVGAIVEGFLWFLKGLAVLLPFGGLALFARWKFRPVGELLRSTAPVSKGLEGQGAVVTRLMGPRWGEGLTASLDEARKALAEDGSPQARAAAEVLAELTPLERERLPADARELALDAVTKGQPRSVLLPRDGALLDVVVVPARYEQPQTLRRFPGFADGWPRHAERLARALPADAQGKPVLGVLLFVEPDAREVTVLVTLEAPGQRLVPAALLDEREAKRLEGRVYSHRGVFSLESAASEGTG